MSHIEKEYGNMSEREFEWLSNELNSLDKHNLIDLLMEYDCHVRRVVDDGDDIPITLSTYVDENFEREEYTIRDKVN